MASEGSVDALTEDFEPTEIDHQMADAMGTEAKTRHRLYGVLFREGSYNTWNSTTFKTEKESYKNHLVYVEWSGDEIEEGNVRGITACPTIRNVQGENIVWFHELESEDIERALGEGFCGHCEPTFHEKLTEHGLVTETE